MWRAAVGLSHRVVGVSRDVVQSLGRSPQPPCTYVIPAALPRPASAGTRDRAADRRPSFVVCGAGRLACEKDWPTLLRAFAAFRTAIGQPVKLVLFGDGPLREELRRLAATLAIGDTLELRGWTPRDAFLSELRRMDLFVLPSRFEGLGMAAVEAMQEGVPTITADFGASYDFIEDGVTGHRFPQGDWAALADLMRWHHDHRSAAACIGLRGRQFVLERYSEENTFGLYPSVYMDGLSP
jgi:glycosyltransferase involved in cell wall biosynthesis